MLMLECEYMTLFAGTSDEDNNVWVGKSAPKARRYNLEPITPDEARQFAKALVMAADKAEGKTPPGIDIPLSI